MPVCKRLGHWLALGNTGRDDFDWASHVRLDGPFAVERVAERVQYAADDRVTGGNRQQCPECFDFVAFLNGQVVTENDDTDGLFSSKLNGESDRTVGEFDHLAGHDSGESHKRGRYRHRLPTRYRLREHQSCLSNCQRSLVARPMRFRRY